MEEYIEALMEVQLENLKPEAKQLFDVIMRVIDERDEYKQRTIKAIEYIENHSLYEEEYDYDYEENSYLSGIDDEVAKKELLEILKGDSNG